MNTISFHPRWREELVASCAEGRLIFELTMGRYHVYFPDEVRWEHSVPDWARGRWKEFFQACSDWCRQERIPITLEADALVYEEKTPGA